MTKNNMKTFIAISLNSPHLESMSRSAWSMAAAVTLIRTSSSLCTRGASRSLLTERQEAESARQSRGEEGEEAGFELQEKTKKVILRKEYEAC